MNMKIEKISENQIRCTLTKEDLASRQLKLSELAYGTEKAKRLFREMMQQANFEFGFEAEDIPLMIEAIPMNAECIVLLITKVEDPEELDTRFAHFSPGESDEEDFSDSDSDEMMDLFQNVKSERFPAEASAEVPERPFTRIFVFGSLAQLMNAAAQIGKQCSCPSALYKDVHAQVYLLALSRGEATQEMYNRVCNTLSEYGTIKRGATSENYLEEHYEVLLAANALQNLSGK